MRLFFVFLGIAAFLGFTPLLLSAHGFGGSLEVNTGEYLVDVGYQPITPSAGAPVSYDFLLAEAKTGRPVEFESVWVRIAKGKSTVFATGIKKAELGPTTLVYTYPGGGQDYELSVRYEGPEGTLAEASFSNLQVGGSSSGGGSSAFSLGSILIGIGIGIMVGFGTTMAARKKG